MGDGYVQIRFNYLTRAPQPVTGQPLLPQQWALVHDATGKLVIRDSTNTVIATARWLDQQASERVHRTLGVPTEEQWSAIEHAIGGALREARNFPPDPRTDDGIVDAPAVPKRARNEPKAKADKQEDAKLGIGGVLVLLLIAAAIAFVIFFVVPFFKKHDLMPGGTAANGEACTTDSDCRSGDCYKKTCRGEALKVRGDRCDRNKDCKSKRCTINICD